MLLYDPDVITARHDPKGPVIGKHGRAEAPRFDTSFRIDLDIDATEDVVTFSKPPARGGRSIRRSVRCG